MYVDELLCVICMNITIERVYKTTAVSYLGERMEDMKDSRNGACMSVHISCCI